MCGREGPYAPAQNLYRGEQTLIGRRHPKCSRMDSAYPAKKEDPMFLIIALVLFLAWIAGFVVFHTAGFLIHLLLLFAVISIIFHFLRGRSSTV